MRTAGSLAGVCLALACLALPVSAAKAPPLYVYHLDPNHKGADAYDEVAALVSMQGLVNRRGPTLYIDNAGYERPRYWLDRLTKPGRWLSGRRQIDIDTLDAVFELARPALKGAVIFDPATPATINVATTAAGVEDAVILSPELAQRVLPRWGLRVLTDLRGRFTGAETGSRKNDAYRWAIRQYLQPGRCSPHFLTLYTDGWADRAAGQNAYNIVRDWAVTNRAFVFDLSPWGDEKPADDLDQPLGTDLATYRMILAATQRRAGGRQMTEMAGFFSFWKYANMPGHASKHEPVPTEWETVWLISPYNCYQNTATEFCYNQSFHRHAPVGRLHQRPPSAPPMLENRSYVAILMADYDSAYPLYHFLPKNWDDPHRGALPLNWGINPNLLEAYPDVIAWYYETATPNDHFVADASCAGYVNPNRISEASLPLFVRHNRMFYRRADMTISAMVLDWDQPTPAVKDAFSQFSPGGYSTIVADFHGGTGRSPDPHVWKGMPVLPLDGMDPNSAEYSADILARAVARRRPDEPGFTVFRCVWVTPTQIQAVLDLHAKRHPEAPVQVVDLATLFALSRQRYGPAGSGAPGAAKP